MGWSSAFQKNLLEQQESEANMRAQKTRARSNFHHKVMMFQWHVYIIKPWMLEGGMQQTLWGHNPEQRAAAKFFWRVSSTAG